jgi:hypothetical protein
LGAPPGNVFPIVPPNLPIRLLNPGLVKDEVPKFVIAGTVPHELEKSNANPKLFPSLLPTSIDTFIVYVFVPFPLSTKVAEFMVEL